MRYLYSFLKSTIMIAIPLLLVTDFLAGLLIEKIAKESKEPLSHLYKRHIDKQQLHYIFGNSRSVPIQKGLQDNRLPTVNMSTNSMTSTTIVAMIKTMLQTGVLNENDIVSIEATTIFNSDNCRTAPYALAGKDLSAHFFDKCIRPLAFLTPNLYKLNTEAFLRMIYSSYYHKKRMSYPSYMPKNSDICNSIPTNLSAWTNQIHSNPDILSSRTKELKGLKDKIPRMQIFSMPYPTTGSVDIKNKTLLVNFLKKEFPSIKILTFPKGDGNDCSFFSDTLHINRKGGLILGIQ